MIVLKPNAMSPQGPFTTGDVTNVLIGIENVGDLNQERIKILFKNLILTKDFPEYTLRLL